MRTLSSIPTRDLVVSPVPQALRRWPDRTPLGISQVGRRVLRAYASDTSELGERWLTKRELAEYLRVTPRFIELQQHLGLPVLRIGAVNRYRISEVEAWVREQYTSTTSVRSA